MFITHTEIRNLVELGYDVNIVDEDWGYSLMHFAVRNNDEELLWLCFCLGWDITLQTRTGDTPIALADKLRKNQCHRIFRKIQACDDILCDFFINNLDLHEDEASGWIV